MMTRAFEPVGLHPQPIQAVTTLGFNTQAPIQFSTIPFLPAGQDVIGQTQTGRTHGHCPADVVGSIAFYIDIAARTTGAIKNRAGHTMVDGPEQFVQQVLSINGGYRVHKQRITIERAKQS